MRVKCGANITFTAQKTNAQPDVDSLNLAKQSLVSKTIIFEAPGRCVTWQPGAITAKNKLNT